MSLESLHKEVVSAHQRIKQYVRRTPLEYSTQLSDKNKGHVHIKLESEQVTGSFKVRGAFNKLCLLKQRGQHEKRVVTASSGNHGLACNYAMNKLGMSGTTFLPTTVSEAKEGMLRRLGAEVIKHGTDCMQGEVKARATAEEQGRLFISPYNDLDVVAGQGTIGLEIYEQCPDVDVVLVPVGGGGLIVGIAAYLKHVKPRIKVIGCQPLASKVMYESIRAGKIVFEDSGETLSDGTAGGIEEGSITFEMCRDLVDDWILVTEEEIAEALYFMMAYHHKIVEGVAGTSIGGFMKCAEKFTGQNVVLLACGANISMDKVKAIVNRK